MTDLIALASQKAGAVTTARLVLENESPIRQTYRIYLKIGEQGEATSMGSNVSIPANDSITVDIPIVLPPAPGKYKAFLELYHNNTHVTQYSFDSIDVGDPGDPHDPEHPGYGDIPEADESEYADYIEFSNFNPDNYPQMGEMFDIKIDASWPIPDPGVSPDPVRYTLEVTGAVSVEEEIIIQPRVTETHTIHAKCDFEGPHEIHCEGFTATVIGEATYEADPPSGSPNLPSYVWCPFCHERFYDKDYTDYSRQVYAATMTHLITTHGPPADQHDTSGTGGVSIPSHLIGDDGYAVERLWGPLLDAIKYSKAGDPSWTDQQLNDLKDTFERDLNKFHEVLNEQEEDSPPEPPPGETLSCGDLTSSVLVRNVPFGCSSDINSYMNYHDMLPFTGVRGYSVSSFHNIRTRAINGIGGFKYLTMGDVAPGYYVGWETGLPEEDVPEEESPYRVWISSIPSINSTVNWGGGGTVIGTISGWGVSPDNVTRVAVAMGQYEGPYEMKIGSQGQLSFIDLSKPCDVSIYGYKYVPDPKNTYWFKYIQETNHYARVTAHGDPFNNSL